MAKSNIEFLAYEETSLGPICLRRRTPLSLPEVVVTEVTLNREFLMSSLHTDSEQALSRTRTRSVRRSRSRYPRSRCPSRRSGGSAMLPD